MTRLHTRELNKTSRDVEAVLMGITTREMVGKVDMGVNNNCLLIYLNVFMCP